MRACLGCGLRLHIDLSGPLRHVRAGTGRIERDVHAMGWRNDVHATDGLLDVDDYGWQSD
jgi:hypothetical protein